VNETFNNESINQVVEVNLYYKEYQEEIEINIVREKKWNIVVATTCHSRTNDLTTSKALQWAIK